MEIRAELSARRDPIASTLQRIYDRVRRQPKRVVFAEGEEEQVIRAAVPSSTRSSAPPSWSAATRS